MLDLLPLTYTRPKHVRQGSFGLSDSASTAGAIDPVHNGSLRSGLSGVSRGIPETLSFDNIMNGGTCPPLTIRDFMNYLLYIEHSAENLQFYLWYREYAKRFETADTADVNLAPEWSQEMEEATLAKLRKLNAESRKPEPEVHVIFKGTDFDNGTSNRELRHKESQNLDPFHTPPSISHASQHEADSTYMSCSTPLSSHLSTCKAQAADAFEAVGARQPFTIQPFREEINRVIATYIMDGAPRQLNLSSWEQKIAVQALSFTTHPSAFRGIMKSIDANLRRQAHPNFVRWSICNGNQARVSFARLLGVFLIVSGFAVAVVLTLSSVSRGYRALAAIAWVLGFSTLIAAYKGMCVVLHGMHHRHVRPWELFVQEDSEVEEKRGSSFDSFGSSNSYEDEPWVVKYEKRNIVRKVFDREVWIQEPALRQIQDTIFVQAMLGALLLSGLLTAVFVSVPGGNFF